MKRQVKEKTPHGDSPDLTGLKDPFQTAKAIQVSRRTLSNWQRQKKIPFIKISERCVRFCLPDVIAALRRFEIKEAK